MSLASADQVAAVTGKALAIESSYLNQLVVMHIVPGASGSNGFFQCCFGGFGLVKGKPWTVEDEKLL